MKKFFSYLKRPPAWFAACAFLLAAACIAGAIACAACGCAGWYAYALYAAAALSLAYIVYLSVRGGSALRAKAAERARAHPLAESFLFDGSFRAGVLFSLSFIVNVAYALLCGVLGVALHSSWYGMFSFYYLLLSALRCGLLAGAMRSRRRAAGDARGLLVSRWKLYRLCGIALFVLEFALAAAVTVMVAVGRPAPVSEVLAIASAAYTFYKVISAAVGFVKVRRLHDPLLQAFRNINLADAAVSLLSLQVTLVAVFSQGQGESMKPLNAAMGFFVCLLTIALGVWMIAEAGVRLRKLQKEEGVTEKDKAGDARDENASAEDKSN